MILAGDDAGRAGEAASLLEAIRPHVQTQRFLRDVVFRYLLAWVRAARLLHDPGLRELARAAPAAAAETTPALPRHPDVGRPRASDADIATLPLQPPSRITRRRRAFLTATRYDLRARHDLGHR